MKPHQWTGWTTAVVLGAALFPMQSSRCAGVAASQAPASPRASGLTPPFREIVTLPTFMEHVLSPAADIVWRASGTSADASGEHDLTPTTNAQWEVVVSGSASLAEATNALMIPQRERDAAWFRLATLLAKAAEDAYRAAETHDAKGIAMAGERIDAACTNCHKHYGIE